MAAPTLRLDYWDGSNWVQALTHSGKNAVLRCTVQKKLDAANVAELILSNKSQNYASTTTSQGASNSSQGKLSGIFTELIDCRIRDEETGTMLFRGRVAEEQNQYNLQSGSTIRLVLREVLSELSDYPLDHAPTSLKSIDIETSSQTPDTQKRSGVIQKILSAVSDNFDTDDTAKFEASQVAYTAEERDTGDTTSSGKDALDITKTGKGQLLRTIHMIASADPHSASNNKHFGYDYYIDPNFTSLATSHYPKIDFNYFLRGTRPGTGGATSSDPTKYGLTVEYPSTGWGGQTNFKKAMLNDSDFDSTTSVIYTSVIAHYTETNSADSGANSQFEATEAFELLPGTITGSFKYSSNRLSFINDSASTNPLLLYRANPTTAINMSGNIDASATALIVDSVTDFVVGQIITVDSEKMTITAINTSTNTFTITRASSSTSAAGHNDDATVTGTVVNPSATVHYQSGTGSSQYIIVANVYDASTTLQFTNETGQDFDPFPTLGSSVRFFFTAGTAASSTGATQLNEALDATETVVTVDSGAVFVVNQVITCESEQMLITSISSNDLTVTRGYNSTTAALHNDDTAVSGFYIDLTPSTARRKNKLSYSKPFRFESQTNTARDSIRNEIVSILDTTATGQITRARFGTTRYPYVKLESAAANVSRSSNVLTFATAPTATTLINMVGNINASVTELVVDSASGFSVNDIIACENEQMQITAISSNTLTVTRGVNRTTAASHDDDTSVTGAPTFTPSDGTAAANNPLTYGVKVGMSVAELNAAGTAVTRYSYISAVNSTTVTYGASDTDTSDGTALDASKPIAIYIPLEPGHSMHVKNNLWGKDYNVLINTVDYEVNNGYITCYMTGYGLDINDAGIPVAVPSNTKIDVDFPTNVSAGGQFWTLASGGKIEPGHSSTASDNYKTIKVTSSTGASTVTLITHPDGKSYILKTGNYDISGSGNTANQWHTLFLRPLAAQAVSSAPLTNDHQSLQVVANARSAGADTLYADIEDPRGDIILGRAKTNLTLGVADESEFTGETPSYEGLALLELTNQVGALDTEQGFQINATTGTNQVVTVNSSGMQVFQNVSGTQRKAISLDNTATIPRITVGDPQTPQNTTQIATTGTSYAVPSQKTTKIDMAGNVGTGAAELTVDSASGFAINDIIRISTSGTSTYGSDPDIHEQMKITDISGAVLDVTRGFNGTTAVTYNDNANVQGYQGHNEARITPNIPLKFHHNISAILSETRASTQLAEALDATELDIDVDSTTGFLAGQFILVESEIMKITAITNSTTLAVLRGDNSAQGTSSATHADNTAVTTWVSSDFGQTTTDIYRQGYTENSTDYQDSAYNSGDNPGRGRNLIINDGAGPSRNPEIPKDNTTGKETLEVASRLIANNLAIQAPRFYGSTWGTGTAQSQLHPTYTFSTDLDTGMYQEQAGTLDFAVGGNREMTLTGDALTVYGNLSITGSFNRAEHAQLGGYLYLDENFIYDSSTNAPNSSDTDNVLTIADYVVDGITERTEAVAKFLSPGDVLQIFQGDPGSTQTHQILRVARVVSDTQVQVERPHPSLSTTVETAGTAYSGDGVNFPADVTTLRVVSADIRWVGGIIQVASGTLPDEQMLVTNVANVTTGGATYTDLTVVRGHNNTTATVHADTESVTLKSWGSFSTSKSTGLPGHTATINEDLTISETDVTIANPSTNLNGAIDSSVDTTSVVVNSVTNFEVGQLFTVDSEQMQITAINTSTNTFTVARAANSTTIASHSDDAAVTGTNSVADGKILVGNFIKIDNEILKVTAVNTGTAVLTVTRATTETHAATHSNGATVTVQPVEILLGREVPVGNILALDHKQIDDNDAHTDYNPGTLAGTTVDEHRYLGRVQPAYAFQQDSTSGMWFQKTTTGNRMHFAVGGTTLLSMGVAGTSGSNHAGDTLWIGKNFKCVNNRGNTNTLVHTRIHGNITPDINRAGDSGSFSHDHLLGTTTLPWYSGAVVNALSETSDVRQKENIVNLTTGLDIINSLTPIQYNKIGQTNVEFGFSAQDVKTQMLALGYTEDIALYIEETDRIDENGEPTNDESVAEQTFWSLRYTELIGPLVAAIKELKAEIDELKNG